METAFDIAIQCFRLQEFLVDQGLNTNEKNSLDTRFTIIFFEPRGHELIFNGAVCDVSFTQQVSRKVAYGPSKVIE